MNFHTLREKSRFLHPSSFITPTKPVSSPARVFINRQEIMYVMRLHSAYERVGVKGNYVPPVCFPQLNDGQVLFFCISLLILKSPQLGLVCSLARQRREH